MKEENVSISVNELKRKFIQGDATTRGVLRSLYPGIFDYPYYGMCKNGDDSAIVLFTDYRTGTVIKGGCGLRLGGRGTDFIEKQFTKIPGITPITK